MGVMPGGSAPPDGPKAPSAAPAPDGPGSDELPNPLEEKRRELRATALAAVLAGEAVPEQRNGSEVVRVGDTEGSSAPDSSTARRGRGGRQDRPDRKSTRLNSSH